MADQGSDDERWEPSEEELEEILQEHERWVESEAGAGKRAVLSKVYLAGAHLAEAKLREADLSEAFLLEADLSGAILRGATLSEAALSGADLSEADLVAATLSEADLRGADLPEADLSGATLSGADLRGADLSEAQLARATLSGAVIDKETLMRSQHVTGARKGVNGIWVESTDSAALMTLTPPGDSMHGRNADAVVESLKHARRLHGISVGVVLLGLGILFVQFHSTTPVETISLPFIQGLEFPVAQFSLLGMSVSVGLLSLVKSFMSDALSGARYLQSRNDAMTVGNFPWALSRYTGRRLDRCFQSLITRLVLAYHPLAYGLFWDFPVPWYYWVLAGVLVILSTWIFAISQQFQRPILFDTRTEKGRKSDLEKLKEAVDQQTETMEQIATLLQSAQRE